ncbi:hypothetical protein EDD17DRAFT_385371 [Pisolithus thermaeus]|nr:hypothetical protein EV401DRAFT_2067035 [Pisolithus croceorrhizus]KAI6164272.1 hypothetical protein EDD17DRAFT_385371 [Pisolithus thermaeus]
MVKKRAVVAAPLHAELTEYTNLIRALRTSRTLDLTTHLLQDAAQQRQSQGSSRAAERDTWTRWPLPDFPIPEWRLDDEVKTLGELILRQLGEVPKEDSITYGQGDASDPEADDLHPPITQLLVAHIGALLAHVLNALADLRPATVASMQNRLSPLNWQDVVNALAAQGVVDQAVISRADERLRNIYGGPSDTKAVERMRVLASAKANYTALTSAFDDILIECDTGLWGNPPPT